jgi:hypothetical protein
MAASREPLMNGPCGEKVLLMSDYETATAKFSATVGELRRKMGTVPKAEYERLARAANAARFQSEQARLAVERHIAAHGC